MNSGKAREYFSDYYENTLDPGLTKGFEAALAQNAELKHEWKEFEATLSSLEGLRDIEIEIPYGLHDKIVARIDHSVWEKKQSPQTGWFTGWWKSLSMGAVACGVAVVSLIAIGNRQGSSGYSAGIVSGSGEPLLARMNGSEFQFVAALNGEAELVVRDVIAGKELVRIPVDHQRVVCPVSSNDPAGRVISVEMKGSSKIIVALPASGQHSVTSGKVSDFAVLLAAKLGKPVILERVDLGQSASWTMGSEAGTFKLQSTLDLELESRSGMYFLVTKSGK
ncbi:MAG: hypothetical protein K8R88_06155 [Armatimonadetes bacterium]|nr:hypothetical protein [Armatimonadota bacterium]